MTQDESERESTYIMYKVTSIHLVAMAHDTAAERDRYLIELLEHSKMKVKLFGEMER
jgi:hypothetical protein